MPPAVLASPFLAAGITAAGAVAGGVIQSGANKRATQAQERANRDALAFERERYSAEQAERQQMRADQQQRLAAWTAARNAILQKHGINVPGAAAPGAITVPGGTNYYRTTPAPAPAAGAAGPAPPALMGDTALEGGPAGPTVDEDGTVNADVLDWRNYGVR